MNSNRVPILILHTISPSPSTHSQRILFSVEQKFPSSFQSPISLITMSQSGKEPDPSKGGAGGAPKDCDACGNRDHVKQASKGENWDKTKPSELSGAAAQASADRTGGDKHGGVLGPVLSTDPKNDGAQTNAQTKCPANVNNWGEFRMAITGGGFNMAEIAAVA